MVHIFFGPSKRLEEEYLQNKAKVEKFYKNIEKGRYKTNLMYEVFRK